MLSGLLRASGGLLPSAARHSQHLPQIIDSNNHRLRHLPVPLAHYQHTIAHNGCGTIDQINPRFALSHIKFH